MNRKKAWQYYLLIHAGLLVLVLLFPLYRRVLALLPSAFGGCLVHDLFFLYCPLCGGTRAVSAILRLDFAAAFAHNALVVILILLILVLDLWVLIRLLRGNTARLRLPKRSWIVLLVILLAYAVLRNYLMIAHGIDPVGDLGAFWKVFKN